MSLRHSVLGLLAIEPATGYDLTLMFDRSLANAWHASHSQIYPELAKLQELGMVEVVGEGARRSRTYAVTDAGREELRRWILNPGDHPRRQRNETAVRWNLLGLVPPEDRRAFLERELADVRAEHERLAGLADRLDAVRPDHPMRGSLDLGVRMTALMSDWLQEQLEAAAAASAG